MNTKTDKVRQLVKDRDYKSALKIAKDFKIGISKEDSEDMKRGYECLVHPRFYQSIGLDTSKITEKGVQTVIRLYG